MSRSGSCTGYSWTIDWTSRSGDRPQMGVDGDDLVGSDLDITVETPTNGGTWIRPLRGDMLRLPETEPQVSAESGHHLSSGVFKDVPSC